MVPQNQSNHNYRAIIWWLAVVENLGATQLILFCHRNQKSQYILKLLFESHLLKIEKRLFYDATKLSLFSHYKP